MGGRVSRRFAYCARACMHSAELIAVAALGRYTDRRELGVRIAMVSTQQVLSVESRLRVQQTSTDKHVLRKSEEGENSPRNEAKRAYAWKAPDGRYLLHVAVHLYCHCLSV